MAGSKNGEVDMIAYDVFLLAPCLSDAYAMDFLYCSREREERDLGSLGPPRLLPPSASGKAYLPVTGSEAFRQGESPRKEGFECRGEECESEKLL